MKFDVLKFIMYLFLIFVPWGYLPWFWALPISIINSLAMAGIAKKIVDTYQ